MKAVQNPLLELVQTIADLTGVSVSKRSLEEIMPDAAPELDAFYRQRCPDPGNSSILVVAVDCKGTPMVKPARLQPTLRPVSAKGQRSNKKRMATVAAVFTRAPWVRTPQQVVESLFRTCRRTPGDEPPPQRLENKRVWASLLKGKTAVILEVAEEMERCDPSASKTPMALTDGVRTLQIRVGKLPVTLTLDLMHVLEKRGMPPMSSMPRAAWMSISGSWTELCESCPAIPARLSKGFAKVSLTAAYPEPRARRCWESPVTCIETASECAMTSTSTSATTANDGR